MHTSPHNPATPVCHIAVLGIGMMGLPMARRLCEAGHNVTVWNRTADKAERLRAFGAHIAPSAA
ncbi:MAG TPA: NAD(P)-binding domain-containing protein, partial [Macromonas sp.]|nr:NAD(P)-binding domain-containing protein [Macromonas sp.]